MRLATAFIASTILGSAAAASLGQETAAAPTARALANLAIAPDPRLPKNYWNQLILDDDQRLLNHLAYSPDAKQRGLKLVSMEPYRASENWDGTGAIRPCLLQEDAAKDLKALFFRANKQYPEDGLALAAYSCFRPIDYQYTPFCHIRRKGSDGFCEEPKIRAFKSAPPGYSEHGTGYTLDIVVRRTSPSGLAKMRALRWCDGGDTEPCPQIAATRVGKWLEDHAVEYGFEMSFPASVERPDKRMESTQGVSFEPWHFRWVGTNDETVLAEDARRLFLRARRCFGADRLVDDPKTEPDVATVKCPKANQPLG